ISVDAEAWKSLCHIGGITPMSCHLAGIEHSCRGERVDASTKRCDASCGRASIIEPLGDFVSYFLIANPGASRNNHRIQCRGACQVRVWLYDNSTFGSTRLRGGAQH